MSVAVSKKKNKKIHSNHIMIKCMPDVGIFSKNLLLFFL